MSESLRHFNAHWWRSLYSVPILTPIALVKGAMGDVLLDIEPTPLGIGEVPLQHKGTQIQIQKLA